MVRVEARQKESIGLYYYIVITKSSLKGEASNGLKVSCESMEEISNDRKYRE